MVDLPDALLLISVALNAVLGFMLLKQNRKSFINKLYAANILAIIAWIIAVLLYRNVSDHDYLFHLTQILYIAPTLIASTFLLFSIYFPDREKTCLLNHSLLVLFPNLIIVVLLLYPGLIISETLKVPNQENIILFGPLYFVYVLYIFLYFGTGILVLLRKCIRSKRKLIRRQIITLLIAYTLATSFAFITNLFLPWFGYFDLNWLGQVFTLFMVLGVSYAIYQHKLFETKLIVTELLVLFLLIVLFAQILLAKGTIEIFINSSVFVITSVVGFLLVKNVNREIETRIEIEKLMAGLAKANRRLQAIDKQKSEFISVASHQLRSPLTAIRGYASMLTEGSFGKFPKKAHKPLETIAESARMMAISIEDYLSVSRIEAGNMKFNYSDFNIVEQAERVTDSLRPQATKQGLVLTFKRDVTSSGEVHADQGKVEQIIHNLVNNALKYTPKGSITVYVHDDLKQKRIYVEVIDTGIGMSQEAQEQLFSKFQRANNAVTVNVHGTGLGLYVAKKMASEMKGDVYGYSEGEGKGSYFILELPLP